LGVALPIAQTILADLAALPGVTQAAVGGSLRRMRETIGDIDLLVAADDADAIMDHYVNMDIAEAVDGRGPTKARVILRGTGLGADLRVLPEDHWGTLLSYFTGSQAHNVRLREMAQQQGLSLNEYSFTREDGSEIICATEEEVYQTLGLPYIPPVLREDRGEIEAAKAGKLPELIKASDIIADLHMHSTWSDGKASILEMARAAQADGMQYVAITDHSASLGIANGLTTERLLAQRDEVLAADEAMGPNFRVLHGTEMEIRADGSLDYPDEVLQGLDFVIASLHVSLRQSRQQATERILNAIDNPHVDMIAHPTGRLLPDREGADLDMDQIMMAASRTGTILEINANPQRLDLRDAHVRRAMDLGVKLALNTDAHAVNHFGLRSYGVATAQRGWATAERVVNTWPIDRFLEYVRRKD
jgi:DNA polymerase (family 10)